MASPDFCLGTEENSILPCNAIEYFYNFVMAKDFLGFTN